MHLELKHKVVLDKAHIMSPNLCECFDREDLDRIGSWVHENYLRDKASRADWERRTEAAMDLAMQLQKDKSFPWPGCANIAFPLITIAAMQFHSRAYPAIVNGRSVVQCRVVGEDPSGVSAKRADAISKHMSWQVLEQDEGWEEATDRSLLNVAIVGVGFKKSFYNSGLGHNVSEFVQAKDLVINYWARSVEDAQVKTHIIPMYRNEVHERCARGSFYDVRGEAWYCGAPTTSESTRGRADDRSGQTQPSSDHHTPFTMLEQHCWLDLDDDGYAEPYIITIEESTQTVCRIVCRFDRVEDIEYNNKQEIIRITATEYFTKIPFIPSPDNGIMDIGFGILLGPLNESVNSAINQLFDAGTMSNTAGGFLGRGAKLKGGVYTFKPFGWERVDATGDDLRKSIFPLPVREPSAVMFNLLSLIIEYTNRISGATDTVVGENPGQNTPAETSRNMLEQGQKIYSAIFKRIWRSLKQEFKKLYVLNAVNLPPGNIAFGDGDSITRDHYAVSAVSVIPVADPLITSEGARFAQAQMLREAAAAASGYDGDEVERRFLKAMGIDDVDRVFPGTEKMGPPAPDVKIQLQQMKNELEMAKLEQKKMEFVMTLQENVRLNNAKIMELTASAEQMHQAAANEPQRRNVEAFRAGIEAMRARNEAMEAQLDREMKELQDGKSRGNGAVPSVEGASGNGIPDAVGQLLS